MSHFVLKTADPQFACTNQMACKIKKEVSFAGDIIWDNTKPNGSLRKILNTSAPTNLGWLAKTDIKFGIKSFYERFLKNRLRIAA